MVYLAGAPAYRQICDDVVAKGYEGFSFTAVSTVAPGNS
jgi:hypothetical protein